MAKPAGSTSSVSLTIDEIVAKLGGRKDVPVKVSKSWLASVEEIFGTGKVEAPAPADEDDEEKSDTAAPAAKSALKIVED